MRAGKLRHRIEIQKPTRSVDAGGGHSVAWSKHARAWAHIETAAANERISDEKLEPQTKYRIEIRHVAGVSEEMRVLFKTRTFRILGIENPEERNEKLILECEENNLRST